MAPLLLICMILLGEPVDHSTLLVHTTAKDIVLLGSGYLSDHRLTLQKFCRCVREDHIPYSHLCVRNLIGE